MLRSKFIPLFPQLPFQVPIDLDQEPGFVAVPPVQTRWEAAKGGSVGRRVKGLPITGCVLSRRQTPIPHRQVFR